MYSLLARATGRFPRACPLQPSPFHHLHYATEPPACGAILPTLRGTVSTHPASNSEPELLELPVEELLRRAHPLPDHDEMAIEDLSEEEGEAFLAAVQS